jgi:hypothetical protein
LAYALWLLAESFSAAKFSVRAQKKKKLDEGPKAKVAQNVASDGPYFCSHSVTSRTAYFGCSVLNSGDFVLFDASSVTVSDLAFCDSHLL